MAIHYRGREYQQRGGGIGGFFKGLSNTSIPIQKSGSSKSMKASKLNNMKWIAKKLHEQALDSTLNMTKDIMVGNDLRASDLN